MKNIIYFIIIILISSSFCYSQYDNPHLSLINKDITYKTDDLKKPIWKINDLDLIIEIIEELNNKKELKTYDGNIKDTCNVIGDDELNKLWTIVHKNDLKIICRQRYYDNQIEHIEFLVNGDIKLKPLNDWILIREALSEPKYEKIKQKNYSYTNYTKENFNTSNDTFYVMCSAISSEAILSSLDLDTKGLFSAYYQMGCDNINLPSWYKGSINFGLKYKLLPYRGRNNINYERFSIALGWDGPLNFSIQNNSVPGFMESMFKERLLRSTSDNLFLGLSFSPSDDDPAPFSWLATDSRDNEFIQLHAEASFPIYESDVSIPNRDISSFYSIRGHFSANGTICNLMNFFNIGASFSYFQLYNYSKITDVYRPSILGSKKHYLIGIEPAISREDMPIAYYISPQINFDLSDGQNFFVLKSQIMFFNFFGVEFKYLESLNKKKTAPWQYDNYIIISPIIRINY
jgi:hypothetical protein